MERERNALVVPAEYQQSADFARFFSVGICCGRPRLPQFSGMGSPKRSKISLTKKKLRDCALRGSGAPPFWNFAPPASRASGDFGELYLDALNAPGCSKVLFEFLQQPVPHELCRGS